MATRKKKLKLESSSIAGRASAAVDLALLRTSKMSPPAMWLPTYRDQDHKRSSYARSFRWWGVQAGMDLSCTSPWNSYGGVKKAGTVIHRRAFITCRHGSYYLKQGDYARFVGMQNQVYDAYVENIDFVGPDLVVHKTIEPLPEFVATARVLPKGWESQIPELGQGPIPIVVLDQEEKGLLYEWRSAGAGVITANKPATAARRAVWEKLDVGDSGNGMFLPGLWWPVVLGLAASATDTLAIGVDVSFYWDALDASLAKLGLEGGLTAAF